MEGWKAMGKNNFPTRASSVWQEFLTAGELPQPALHKSGWNSYRLAAGIPTTRHIYVHLPLAMYVYTHLYACT